MTYTVLNARSDYESELGHALRWKEEGRTAVDGQTAGHDLAQGRAEVPIDEYIAVLRDGLKKLEAMDLHDDAEEFNY